MRARFILGKAGTGKTKQCVQEITAELQTKQIDNNLIYIVPEQATFQMEKRIACDPKLGGLMRLQVLSFRRLAWKAFNDLGIRNSDMVGDLGKQMLLKKLLIDGWDGLKVFLPVAKKQGFLSLLTKTFSEMKAYMVTSSQLKASAKYLQRDKQQLTLAEKLDDISLLYDGYEASLEGKYMDPDDTLSTLAETIMMGDYFAETKIWIDDFTGFTPQEYRVIEALLIKSTQVTFSLCIEPSCREERIEEEEPFYITKETYFRLLGICADNGVEIEEEICLSIPHRFARSPALYHLEKTIYHPEQSPYTEQSKDIGLASAVNRRVEIEGIAKDIHRLVRERGYRWRDMALLFRDFAGYEEIIEAVFADYEIPYFIDKKRDVSHHPLIELVISFVETVLDPWNSESLFRLLKTDFFPFTRDEVDRLENYVMAHGIRSGAWKQVQDWQFCRKKTLGEEGSLPYWEQEKIRQVNVTRERVVHACRPYFEQFELANTVQGKTEVLFSFLEGLAVGETLESWNSEDVSFPLRNKGFDHNQLYAAVEALFNELLEILGEESLALKEYYEIIKVGLESIELGIIPPSLDQVIVAQLGRSRLPATKGIFLAGVVDGVFPMRPAEEGIFTDQERTRLQKLGIELAPGEERLLIDEEYLVYNSLTRAEEYLLISYPLADHEGRALLPSTLIDQIRRLFPAIEERFFAQEAEEPISIYAKNPTMSAALGEWKRLKEGQAIDVQWLEVYNWFIRNKYNEKRFKQALQGLFWNNQEVALSKQTLENLYGERLDTSAQGLKKLKTSITRVEKYNQCPFAHFLTYDIRLRKRLQQRLESPDFGNFYHVAIKGFFERIDSTGIDMARVEQEQLSVIVDEVASELLPQLQNELLLSSSRYRFLGKRLRAIVESSLWAMIAQAGNSKARPLGHEVDFGFEKSLLDPIEIPVYEDLLVSLSGRIDRVDFVRDGEQSYVIIIDYKSGKMKLDLKEFYEGLSLQLFTYLLVCLLNAQKLTEAKAKPGGICYFRVHNPIISMRYADEEKLRKSKMKEYKLEGLLLADESFIRLLDTGLASGWSDFLPIGLGKEGFYEQASIFSEKEYELMKTHFYQLIQKSIKRLLAGNVAIEPVKRGQKKACTYCDYKAICQFDPLFEENQFRGLGLFGDKTVWQQIEDDITLEKKTKEVGERA